MPVFPVARMSPVILGLTLLLLPLPALFLWIGCFGRGPQGPVMLGTGVFIAAIYGWIWALMRPARYELGPSELVLASPLRRIRIPRHDLAGAQIYDLPGFRAEFGNMIRVGAGGLFGTFGWLWNRKSGRMDCYVTNLGPWVVVRRRTGRAIILSPADPESFAAAIDA